MARKMEWLDPLVCARCGNTVGWSVAPPDRTVCNKCADEEDKEMVNDWGTVGEAEERVK